MFPRKCWYITVPEHHVSAKWQPGKCMGWIGTPTAYAFAVVCTSSGKCIMVPISNIRFGSKPKTKSQKTKKAKSK